MDQQKICCLCRRPISGFGNKTLQDGAKVCKACLSNIAALPNGDIYSVSCEYDTAQQVKARVAQMEQTRDQRNQLEQTMADRAAQFTKTRSFDVPGGMLIAVDDAHHLVRFNIKSNDSWPGLTSVTLAISELIDATATAAPAVDVESKVACLPPLTIPVPMSDEGIGTVGGFLLGGIAGAMIASSREESREQFGYQTASQAAQFIKTLIHPPSSSQVAPPTVSPVDELIKWKSLLDSGGITQDEYDAKKKQLLGAG